jgi:hypothetical protein
MTAPTIVPPTLDEQIAWADAQAQWLRRQQFTLVETGRMPAEEAAKRLALAEAVAATLRAARPDITHTFRGEAQAGRLKSPHAHVRIECGAAYENVSVLNADLVVTDRSWRIPFVTVLDAKVEAVIRQGLGIR